MNHLSTLSCIAYWLLWNICTSLTQRQSLAGVQHTAVSITTTIDQVVLSLLSSSAEHGGALEPVGNHGLGNLGTEVAQVNAKGVTTGFLHIGQSLLSVDLTLNDADRTLVDTVLTELLFIRSDNGLTAINSQ